MPFIEAARAAVGRAPPSCCATCCPMSSAWSSSRDSMQLMIVVAPAQLSRLGVHLAADWGAMVADGRVVLRRAPHVTVLPGLVILAVSLAFNFPGRIAISIRGRSADEPGDGALAGDITLQVSNLATRFGSTAGVPPSSRCRPRARRGRTTALVGELARANGDAFHHAADQPPGRAFARFPDCTDLLGLDEEEMTAVRGARIGMIFQDPLTSLNPALSIGRQIAETILPMRMSPMSRRGGGRSTAHPCRRREPPGGSTIITSFQRRHAPARADRRHQLPAPDHHRRRADHRPRRDRQAKILRCFTICSRRCTPPSPITHDLGVVASMADEVLVICRADRRAGGCRYAVSSSAPHTKALLACMAGIEDVGQALEPIEGMAMPIPRPDAASRRAVPRRKTDAGWRSRACARYPPPRRWPACSSRRRWPMAEPLLEVAGLMKRFAGRGSKAVGVQAVADVHLTLARGETLGLVGESGCGKSTLSRLILSLIDSDHGHVRIDGADFLSAPTRQTPDARRIQIVSGCALLFHPPHDGGRHRRADAPSEPGQAGRARGGSAALELVGLRAEDADRYPHEFSGDCASASPSPGPWC